VTTPPLRCPYCLCGFHGLSEGKCPVCLHPLSRASIKQAVKLAPKVFGDAERQAVAWQWQQTAKAEKPKKKRRRKIGSAKRQRIYERDGNRCVRCGLGLLELLTLDHIVPQSRGGTNAEDNLQTMCRSCNGRKGHTMPSAE
jgi:5-methylcytosine-specific restriction endonuclease McrA